MTPTSHLQLSGPPVLFRSTGGQGYAAKEVHVAAFSIDRTEVTREQYKAFLVATGYRPPYVDEDWARDGWNWTGVDYPPGTGDHPVVLVSWYDADEYCRWAGKRLPTEAEWQLAALGPSADGRTFPWGTTYEGSRLNHGKMMEPNFDDSDGFLYTSPVGAFPSGKSHVGAEDMFGNAWEFTSDARVDGWELYQFAGEVDGKPAQPTAPGPGLYVAVRGGAYFFDFEPNPGGERNEFLPELRRKTSGFRCAR
jgi:serine/threonine-protein kinase